MQPRLPEIHIASRPCIALPALRVRREAPMADAIVGRYLSINDVIAETSLSRTTIYRMIRKGDFPASIQLSAQRVAWDSAALQTWKNERASGPPI